MNPDESLTNDFKPKQTRTPQARPADEQDSENNSEAPDYPAETE